jgi:hypothetical protein
VSADLAGWQRQPAQTLLQPQKQQQGADAAQVHHQHAAWQTRKLHAVLVLGACWAAPLLHLLRADGLVQHSQCKQTHTIQSREPCDSPGYQKPTKVALRHESHWTPHNRHTLAAVWGGQARARLLSLINLAGEWHHTHPQSKVPTSKWSVMPCADPPAACGQSPGQYARHACQTL